MAKMRGIKPEFWTDGAVASLSPLARCLFIGMWHYCCDNGHLMAKPRDLKIRVLPLDACDVEELLTEIRNAEPDDPLLVLEEGGYTVPNLRKHQQIHSRWETKCPRCDNGGTTGVATVAPPETHRGTTGEHGESTDELKGSELKGIETTSRAEPERADVERLCARLADRIEGNGSKRPTITKAWRDAARLLLDRDGRTEEQVAHAIDWCQADPFWRSNVLSMPTLRKQYDRLRLASMRQTLTPVPDPDDDLPDWKRA